MIPVNPVTDPDRGASDVRVIARLRPTLLLSALVLGAATADARAQDGPSVTVLSFDPGGAGAKPFRARVRVRNDGDRAFPFALSVRLESAGRGSQGATYRLLEPGEIAEVEHRYRVPDRGYRLLVAYLARADHMPTDEIPYPAFEPFEVRRHALPAGGGVDLRFWIPPGREEADLSRPPPGPLATEVAGLLDWDRPAAPDSTAVLDAYRIGPYRLTDLRVATGPGRTIDVLLVRRDDREEPLPTVLYLPGNPPGTRRSGIVSAMFLADAGLQVAAVDRREEARETGPGEWLSSRADPVFDDRRVVDHLLARGDVAGERVGVFGFSVGASEGSLLALLDPRVGVAALASRMVVEDSLFGGTGWIPTLWSEEVLEDVGLGESIDDWDALWEAATPELGARALRAYRARYPFFDRLDPAVVLPTLAPMPLLVVAGAIDPQFPLAGVLALDAMMLEAYREKGVPERAELHLVSRGGHALTPSAMEAIADWFRVWLGPRSGAAGVP